MLSDGCSPRASSSTWMVKRSEIGEFGGAWLQGYSLSVGSEVMHRFSRVRRAAPSHQMQPDELLVASYGTAKTPL